MKLERTKNAKRNIIFGVFLNVYQILVPFLMRTAMIYLLGMEYLGLNNLFTSILQVLNLAELGIGSAMVYSMYEPIINDDVKTIRALLNMYRRYYHVIGMVVLIAGLVLLPFLPFLIKMDTVPEDINVYLLYLLYLGTTVLSYLLFSYKSSLLTAHQRSDVISKITLITNTVQYVIQFAVLILFQNYYYYVIAILVTQVLTNLMIAWIVKKMYPSYYPQGSLDEKITRRINGRVRDLFTAKLGGVIVNSADTVVISAFLGLTVLAVYQNYYYILSAIFGFVIVVFNACSAGIGNSLIVETKEKNYHDFCTFTLLIGWISGFCASCLLCLYQPFMEMWVGRDNMLSFQFVIVLVAYYFIYEINQMLNVYKDAAGIWHEDRFRPLVTALGNLVMNLILVQICGLYGILISTIISMVFIGMPWLLGNLFTVLFQRSPWQYILRLLYYTVVSAGAAVLAYVCASLISAGGIAGFVLKAAVCIVIPNFVFFVMYHRLPEFQSLRQLVYRMTGKKKVY